MTWNVNICFYFKKSRFWKRKYFIQTISRSHKISTWVCFALFCWLLWLSLQWRHNDYDSDSNHQPRGCLLNRLFRRRSKKTSKLCVTGLCLGNSPGPVNSPHKWPVTRKMFPFDDVIMVISIFAIDVIYIPHSPGSLDWHWINSTIVPVSAKSPWIRVKRD